MKISELSGHAIKVGKTSVTAVGDNGKTCGVVRNAVMFSVLTLREQMEHNRMYQCCKAISKFDSRYAFEHTIICGKKAYYLRDMSHYENWERLHDVFEQAPETFSADIRRHEAIKATDEAIRASDTHVLDVRIIKK